MLLVMVVALFTSRIVLEALGVIDYGIYNVVGGLSSSFIFFSSALSTSTQRYLNFELGKNSVERVQNVFNLSLLIYTAIAVIIILVGLSFGRWFVENKLVIPSEQVDAAVQVLYATILSLASVFIFSVYESVLIARENMKIYAYLGILDVLMKLGVAYLIMITPNRLILYAWLIFIVQVLPKLILAIYCARKYPEVHHQFYWNKNLFKEMFGFTGWNIYGSGVWMINEQGINILLNMFFGPAINAARGIATQVNAAVTNFSNNFFVAVRPQIIKRYSCGENESLISLIYSSSRFTIYLLWLLSLPLIIRANQILAIWLKDVPDYATLFVQWILIYSIINSVNNPVWTALMATGRIRKTVIIGSNLFLLAFPASFIALKLGMSPAIVYPFLAIGRIIFLIVALLQLKQYISVSFTDYFKQVLIPSFIVIIISASLSWGFNLIFPNSLLGLMGFVVFSMLLIIITIYIFGLRNGERHMISSKIKSILKK